MTRIVWAASILWSYFYYWQVITTTQEENTVVPELVNDIIGLPPTSHPALLLTSVDLLKGRSDRGGRMKRCSEHENLSVKVVEWLLHLAVTPVFAAPAAEAIDK
ncbi:hypothetical protein GCK32_019422, partial [Trichostrongylus colubriformis]